jgi:CubicO group peptidase (beta-lactamase class C family)
MDRQQLAYMIQAMEQAIENGELPGVSTLVFQKGKEEFFHACGAMDMEAGIPLKRDTLFRIFSMTKPVTAAAAMILMQRGLLSMGTPVSHYLSGFHDQKVAAPDGLVPARREVTIRDLLNMTSGLVYPGNDVPAESKMATLFAQIKSCSENGKPVSTVEFANRIGRQPLAFHPGDSWRYGTSADVLGAVIEIVAKMPFGDFLRKEIFEPLGMHDTGFYVPHNKADRFSRLYCMINGHLEVFLENHLGLNDFLSPPAFQSGGAGLISTIDDMLNFCRMLMGKGEMDGIRILSPAAAAYMSHHQLTPLQMQGFNWDSLSGYGYGCFMRVLQSPSQSRSFGSAGEFGWDGWTGTYMTIDPAHELILLVMMQKTDSGITDLTWKIRNIVYAGI